MRQLVILSPKCQHVNLLVFVNDVRDHAFETVVVEEQSLHLLHLHQARGYRARQGVVIEVQQSQRAVVLGPDVARDRAEERVPREVEHVRAPQPHSLVQGARESVPVHAEEPPVVGTVLADVRRQRARQLVLAEVYFLCVVEAVNAGRYRALNLVVVQEQVPSCGLGRQVSK